MLIFFIHGVATRNVQYAETLQQRIRDDFFQRSKPLPHFYASFWGNVLKDVPQMWNCIYQDLQALKQAKSEIDVNEAFRYQDFRQGFLSDFVGDFFTYLNRDRGWQIRKVITQQLQDFIHNYPHDTEIHIVAHSLGTVILWDMLFSDRFESGDPAFKFRSLIQGLSSSENPQAVSLKSITTMGAPIVFVNTMLAVKPQNIQAFTKAYTQQPIQWLNLIHGSDVIAYPLKATLNLEQNSGLELRDEYITEYANLPEKIARSTGQEHAAMALGANDGHLHYWQSKETAELILEQFREADAYSSFRTIAIARLKQVPGMTITPDVNRKGIITLIAKLDFSDRSGFMEFFNNPLQSHGVQIFDEHSQCVFHGYLGWIHVSGLMKEVEFIKKNFTA